MKWVWLIVLLPAGVSACSPGTHQLVADGKMEALQARLSEAPEELESRDTLNKTPLHKAITFDRKEVFEYLIAQGADVEARDDTGMRPLHVAAALNRAEYAAKLIGAGADPEAIDAFGDTPLHTAAMFAANDVIKVLIDEAADLLAVNNEGLTPAGLARKHRRDELAAQLEAYIDERPGITAW